MRKNLIFNAKKRVSVFMLAGLLTVSLSGCGDPGIAKGTVDKEGNPVDALKLAVSENSYSSVEYFNEQYVLIQDENDKWGVADLSGAEIITPGYYKLIPFGDYLVCQKEEDSKLGVMDAKSATILSEEDKIEVYGDVLIATEMNGNDVVSHRFYDNQMNLIFDSKDAIDRCREKYEYNLTEAAYGEGVLTFYDPVSGVLVAIKEDTINDTKTDGRCVQFSIGDSYSVPANGYISVLNAKVVKDDEGKITSYPFISCENLNPVQSPEEMLLSADNNTVGNDGWAAVLVYEKSGEDYKVKKHGYYNVNSGEFTEGADGTASCIYRDGKSVSVDNVTFETVYNGEKKDHIIPYNLSEQRIMTEKQYKDIREKRDGKYYLVNENGKWAYCDEKFAIASGYYKDATIFSNGYAYVKDGSYYIAIDEEFNVVSSSVKADGLEMLSPNSNNAVCRIKKGGKYKIGYLK